VRECRACGAGAERGEGDSAITELVGDRFGEREHVRFGGVVYRHVRSRLKRRRGRDIHDTSLFAREHIGEEELGERRERANVHLDHVQLALERIAIESSRQPESRVVDEDVDALSARLNRLVELPRCVLLREIGHDGGDRHVVAGGELVGERLQCRLGPGRDDHIVAVAGQEPGELEAEAAGGAGDEGGWAGGEWLRHRLNRQKSVRVQGNDRQTGVWGTIAFSLLRRHPRPRDSRARRVGISCIGFHVDFRTL